MIELAAKMIIGHALADYPLQGNFLSVAKNHAKPIPGVPFWQALWAHSAIHAGFVWLITGMPILALAEFVIHCATDYAKCDGHISFNTDQVIHIVCKIVWAVIAVYAST